MTDIYDAPAWQEFMGPITYPNTRIGLQYCIDGFPVNGERTKSMKIGGFMNLSLPPTARGKPENMSIAIVIPTAIKDVGQKKYYDWMATYELNDLFYKGVEGVFVKIFSSSMDTPGRAELMGKFSLPACLPVCCISNIFIHVCVLFFFLFQA